ncbi:hypothetical protein IFM89_017830 [Coptis chinensis]|uniref:Oligopeptide transporter 4 n=1 Tax=Coptis chinensis TaxID=261450 RepID=A0A835I334_9MAGN|nr:hypothetical protein IFM89_017830 [Coptis chinensis]
MWQKSVIIKESPSYILFLWFSPTMGTFEIEAPGRSHLTQHQEEEEENIDEEELSPIEEVRLTVTNTDDPTLPVWTFRMWFLGLLSCSLLSFLNQFFAYRTEPLVISQITIQVASLPIGHFMAKVLPTKKFSLGAHEFSLNPGPFNMKEHVLISIFANAGSAFGSGSAYAVGIVNIIKAFYHRNISFFAGWVSYSHYSDVVVEQVLGYGWAGLLRKYVVEPAHMWWPSTLVQVSLFRALHEKDKQRMSRAKFFLIAMVCSFSWYLVPGYLFPTLSSVSWVCWAFSKSVTAQQLGSGMRGLGLGAFTLDWSVVASFLFSPLICPFFAIMNVFAGYTLIIYVVIPIAYWGLDLYSAKTFPIFSSHLFTENGQRYNISAIVNNKFEINMVEYQRQGKINLSMFFALTYGFGFATIAATLTHVGFFYGREIYDRYRQSYKGKVDIHTRLMRSYEDIPNWWFYLLLLVTVGISLFLCTVLNDQIQMPWWGLLFSCVLAFVFTLPISIITATTNQTPGLNIITEYVMGIIYPGRPIANVCFKTYGYMSMAQSRFLPQRFQAWPLHEDPTKIHVLSPVLGHAQVIVSSLMHQSFGDWWDLDGFSVLLETTDPFNWFFLGGALGPVLVWLLHRAFPNNLDPLINLPVLLGATASMPPATTLNYNSWVLVGTIFNFFVFSICLFSCSLLVSLIMDAKGTILEEDEVSPIEQVRLTVKNTDDPSLPVWTFRMWFLGIISCVLLSFLNQFFAYRTEPIVITQITVQIASLPIGRFMAAKLPTTKFHIPGFGSKEFSFNPGPFNIKEHVLITIFANAGTAFGGGSAYAVGIVDIIKAFYRRNISLLSGWMLVLTTQVLGYGWAGICRKYVVNPAHMWWPSTLVQVSLFQ